MVINTDKRKRVTVIVEKDEGILINSHKNHTRNDKPLYMLPGGPPKLREGETYIAAASRILKNETGLHSKEIKHLFNIESKNNSHKVFYILSHGTIQRGKNITNINFLNDKNKNRFELAWHVDKIVEKYKSKLKKERKKDVTQSQIDEIKQMLKDRKSLDDIEAKILLWKKRGYDVSELEKMLEEVKNQ
jgi:ADP-ribose pyrophosphatase YjhB (NUDIX family)